MSPEENKAIMRRFYEEIDKGNIGVLDELVVEDYINHDPPPFPGLEPGREGLKQAFKIFQEATPGYHRIEQMIADACHCDSSTGKWDDRGALVEQR